MSQGDGKTRYGFAHGISGFFEFPTDNARRLLPAHLEPVEVHHGSSVFSMTAFDFTESEVGAYAEVVMAVVVAPLVKPGEPLPHSALYPYLVATSTRASREHAIERWHLPHWMEDVLVAFEPGAGRLVARVTAGGRLAAELTITEHSWKPVAQRFQTFMKDDAGAYLANMLFEGEQSEHEEEGGRLVLHDHPFNQGLEREDVSDTPFRELWMRRGLQTFDPLITLDRG